MQTTRFLLPFVHGVDTFAIEQAILLAKSHQAVLVPLVLIDVPEERRKKGVRLEYLQQSKDFLETVKKKADWYAVRIEKLEVFTSDVVRSINLKEGLNFVQELRRRFSHWLNKRNKRQRKLFQEQEYLDEEVELSVRA